jgi:hypothetical protein
MNIIALLTAGAHCHRISTTTWASKQNRVVFTVYFFEFQCDSHGSFMQLWQTTHIQVGRHQLTA